jgi:hypothetical protein
MITKESFIKIMDNIQKQREVDDEISTALEKVCGSYVIFNTENLMYKSLHDLLNEVFKDKGTWIEWWLYENVDKKCYLEDGKSIDLSRVEDLYDFLIENMKE